MRKPKSTPESTPTKTRPRRQTSKRPPTPEPEPEPEAEPEVEEGMELGDDEDEQAASEPASGGGWEAEVEKIAVALRTKSQGILRKLGPPDSDDSDDKPLISSIQRHLSSSALPCIGLESQFKAVKAMLEGVIIAGQSSSLILVGPLASGKKATLTNALADVCQSHPLGVLVVRLHGRMHTDEQSCWKAISAQMTIGEVSQIKRGDGFSQAMTQLLRSLEGATVTRSVIFVLDCFHLFLASDRQSVVYSLFDLCHSSRTRIGIIGITQFLSPVRLMEKRVASRFSNRCVVFGDALHHGPRIIQGLVNRAVHLALDESWANALSKGTEDPSHQRRAQRLALFASKLPGFFQDHETLKFLEQHCAVGRDMRWMKRCFAHALSKLRGDSCLRPSYLRQAVSTLVFDASQANMHSLSHFEFLIVISACRVIGREQACNYERMYTEMRSLPSYEVKYNSTFKAFQRLVALGVVVPCDQTSRQPLSLRILRLVVPLSVVETELNLRSTLPIAWKKWAVESLK
eukprot:c19675_g1_i1.p1 GENE.c19675_g1_i1~~c19675_g1_i1.p1  ORF type:complete len:529 (-),score=99.76 c19675_g1_i1:124-1671(-)